MLSHALLNLIEDKLTASERVQVHQTEQIVQLIFFVLLLLDFLLLCHHLVQMDQIGLSPEELLELLKIETGLARVNDLALEHRDEDLAKPRGVFGPCRQQLVAERIARGHQILRVCREQLEQEVILGLSQKLDDALIPRVIHIDVKLLANHHQLLLWRVLVAILVQSRLLEKVLGPDGWHLWSTALPLRLDEDLTVHIDFLLLRVKVILLLLVLFDLFLLGIC